MTKIAILGEEPQKENQYIDGAWYMAEHSLYGLLFLKYNENKSWPFSTIINTISHSFRESSFTNIVGPITKDSIKEPVKKPIEFVKGIDKRYLTLFEPVRKPSCYSHISVHLRTDPDSLDVFVCVTPENNTHLYVGHFNDGVVE